MKKETLMKRLATAAAALTLSTSAYAHAITFDISGSYPNQTLTELHSVDPFYVDYFSAPGFTHLISETLYQGGNYDVSYGVQPWTTEIGWQNLYGAPHVGAFYEPEELIFTPHEGGGGAAPEASTWLMVLMGFAAIGYSTLRRAGGVREPA